MNNTTSLVPEPEIQNSRSKTLKAVAIGLGIAIVVLGATYMLIQRRSSGEPGENKYGILPIGTDVTPTPVATTSGLSGRTCPEPNRRPIGVMLAGDPINRPVSGFADADMVWELPVLVSDVTRLTAVYQCGQPTEIGSVRSARHDYLFLADGVDAIVGHWGGSYHALNRIAAGEFQTINALSNPFNAYYRKSTLPAPYNGFTSYEGLWNALQKLGYRTTSNFAGFPFKDDAAVGERGTAGKLSIAWPGAFRVSFEYDPTTNRYQRYWADVKQLDAKTNVPVAPSVVAIMTATNGPADGPGGYNDVGIEGQGALQVYQDGKVIKGTWKKNELNKKDPVHFLDEQGKQITFTRGQLWVMAVEPSIGVTWTQQ